jgi:DNA-directed RNA polymerase subunit RPC12/RpoP
MSNGARDLLTRGIAAAKANDEQEARFYLEWVLRTDASREQKAQAWLWLSQITDDLAERRNCLEEALAQDPSNHAARRGLAIVDGRLDPAKIIDPDRRPSPAEDQPPQPLKTQRFVCARCGGKMAFEPDGRSLQCQYCGYGESLLEAMGDDANLQEQDFVVAMATAKGHTRPVGMRAFSCQGCGASFLLAPSVLSLTCAYCGSAHVAELPETRSLIPPEGLIPFGVSEEEARRKFHRWFDEKGLRGRVKVSPVRGLYLPAWTFDLSGEIRWQCYTDRDESPGLEIGGLEIYTSGSGGGKRTVREEGSHLVYEDDILVPASHKLPPDLLIEEAERFLLSDVVPYDQGYLADWPAEVYEISVSDASLVARRVALERARGFVRTRVGARLGNYKDLQLNSTGVVVESYKLILLPLWIARYQLDETIYHVLINGQTGQLRAQGPKNWLQRFLDSLFS